ncbi:MAG: hypothetical protein KDI44_19335 [Thiothrix sp.]|nr:hypothetical protein [Thiothrix sp.]
MARAMMLVFSLMTAGAGAMTWYNVGLEETRYDQQSVRTGSQTGRLGGGYRAGK